jgi:hypothetical protein
MIFEDNQFTTSNANAGQFSFNSQWAIECEGWYNRLTVYMVRCQAMLPASQFSAPGPVQIQFRTGIPFVSDAYKVSQVIVTPPSYVEAGLILDVSLPPFRSVECFATVLTTTVSVHSGCRMQLRAVVRNYGTPVTPEAVYGSFTTMAPSPTYPIG